MNIKPCETSLLARIRRQLERTTNKSHAALIWRGYLSGIFEWGLISPDAYKRMMDELPDIGKGELFDLFMDDGFVDTEDNKPIGQQPGEGQV